jgi:hypothetical protein
MKREKLIMVSLLFYYATETRNSYIIIFRGNPRFCGKKFKMITAWRFINSLLFIFYCSFFISYPEKKAPGKEPCEINKPD